MSGLVEMLLFYQVMKINQGAIIGAGSVVTHDIPPYVIAAGNPCQVLRSITKEDVHKVW